MERLHNVRSPASDGYCWTVANFNPKCIYPIDTGTTYSALSLRDLSFFHYSPFSQLRSPFVFLW